MTDRPDDADTQSAPDAPEPWRDDDAPSCDTPAADAAPAVLWPVVEAALAEREWTFDIAGETAALVRVHGLATNYDIALSTFEELGVARCSFALHLYVAEPFRAAALDLINRINFGELLVGSFELEPESGRVRFRQSTDVEGGTLVPPMVHNLINAGMWACDRFWPALVAVGTLGTSPEAALEIAREG